MSRLPIIGVTDCSQQSGLHAQHISGDTSVRCAASKARRVAGRFRSAAGQGATSDILDACNGIPFAFSPTNIDLFQFQSLCRAPRRARDSARTAVRIESARQMQRQRKGQVSSSFIVYARCQA
jgi:putative glutamine amidotransferase